MFLPIKVKARFRPRLLAVPLLIGIALSILTVLSTARPSAAGSYWRPTLVNDCPAGLVCATMDLERACCIEPEHLWTTDGSNCPSNFRHIHSFDERF